ncbi:SurA N-terminal domain-containing protein [Kitasatospora camelliae]|uniref:SurA N-terminal domain-containing protein n=1 Tax=Kitasatospora camelliae TaxID=3156397 RepID=A0AAU8JXN4_9ACTN
MIRTSSAVRRRAAAATTAALAAAVLSACGAEPPHQGAAAVVGGERIPIATVDARVAAVRDAAAGQDGGPRAERAGLARRTVAELVLDRVIARAMADRGLTVSDAEVADARGGDAKLLGGEDALSRELLLKQSVPAEGIDAFYRQQLSIRKLASAAGQDARTPTGDAAVRQALVAAGSALSIEVNPRYGHWDPKQIGLTETVEDWLPRNRTLY